MRVLIDSCVSSRACKSLDNQGHDVEWVPEIFSGDPGAEAVIDRALATGRVLITGDKDFGEWIFLRGKAPPPLLRLAAMTPEHQVHVIEVVLAHHEPDLEAGALVTATTDRIRIRRLD